MVTDTCMAEIAEKEKEIEDLKAKAENAQNELAGVRAELQKQLNELRTNLKLQTSET